MNPEEEALDLLIKSNTRERRLKSKRNKTDPLHHWYQEELNYEVGIDEAGRGPLFGRLYVAAVILPRNNFRFDLMKDSKRFSSIKKIKETAEYIKEHALAWSVNYIEPQRIDEINIRQSVFECMHKCIRELEEHYSTNNTILLVDGCDFKEYYSNITGEAYKFTTIEGGDNWYCSIAAASILAKVARDDYIYSLCEENPYLSDIYGLDKHKGYGTKKHLDAIREHGITPWHRKTFGICRNYI